MITWISEALQERAQSPLILNTYLDKRIEMMVRIWKKSG